MGDDLSLPERNCARTPMQWSDEPNAGFSTCERLKNPVIAGGPYGYKHINAAVQRRHPQSLLNWTERIIRMRKELLEIGWGDFVVLKVRDCAVLALRYEWRNNFAVVVHNLASEPREVVLDVGLGREGRLLINLLGEEHSTAQESGAHRLVLEGYGYRWYRVSAPMNSSGAKEASP